MSAWRRCLVFFLRFLRRTLWRRESSNRTNAMGSRAADECWGYGAGLDLGMGSGRGYRMGLEIYSGWGYGVGSDVGMGSDLGYGT